MPPELIVREATAADAPHIAVAHMDSIATLGPAHYGPEIVADWGAPRDGTRYVEAMARGERMFVAEDRSGDILGFSSHRVRQGKHRIAVYVAGRAARRGVGTALFQAAAVAARDAGGTTIHVDASLGAVPFYERLGFVTLGKGEHAMRSGRTMACVFMTKAV